MVSAAELEALNQEVNVKELFNYRAAVGRQTRGVVRTLSTEELYLKTPPERLARVLKEGAVLAEAEELIKYWGRRKIFELLLMPPTRHLMVHLNEAHGLKKSLI